MCLSELGSAQETSLWKSYSTKWSLLDLHEPIVARSSRQCPSNRRVSFEKVFHDLCLLRHVAVAPCCFLKTTVGSWSFCADCPCPCGNEETVCCPSSCPCLSTDSARRKVTVKSGGNHVRVAFGEPSPGIRQGISPVGRTRRFLPVGLRLTSCRELHSLCHCL